MHLDSWTAATYFILLERLLQDQARPGLNGAAAAADTRAKIEQCALRGCDAAMPRCRECRECRGVAWFDRRA